MPRRVSQAVQERVTVPFSHGSAAATTTAKLWKTPPGRAARVDRVRYVNPTGLVGNASNFFDVQIRTPTPTVAAKWSTSTAAESTLAANTIVSLTPSATDANRVIPADTDVELNLALTGTQTLPAGSGVIEFLLL